jgi:hypothetical protein
MKFNWKRLLQAVAVAALTTTFAPSAWAQTAYLYYAGGAVNPVTSIDPADVHTAPTGDQGVFSVWVADINLADGSVSNWRRAGALLPEVGAAPADDLYSWLFVENTVHIANGYLYVGAGDWNGDGTRDTADVLAYARIKSDGTLEPFQLSAVFPGTPDDQSIGAGALVNAGGGNVYYYILGGTSSGTDRVIYTKLNPTNGTPGPWSVTTSISGADWFNRAAVVGTTIIEANGNLRTTPRHGSAERVVGPNDLRSRCRPLGLRHDKRPLRRQRFRVHPRRSALAHYHRVEDAGDRRRARSLDAHHRPAC